MGKTFLLLIVLILFGCGKKSRWTVWNTSNTPLRTNWIRQVVPDGDTLWVGTYGGGLLYKTGDNWTQVPEISAGEYVLRLKKMNGLLWVGTAKTGIYRRNPEGWAWFDTSSGLCDQNVWDFTLDPQGTVLTGSRYRGLSRIENGKPTCLKNEGRFKFTRILVVETGPDSTIWVGTAENGLFGIKGSDTLHYNTKNGLTGNYIRAIAHIGHELWVGSWNGGLDIFDGKSWRHETEVPKPVVALAQGADNRIWIGTWGKGVFLKTEAGYSVFNISNSGLPHNEVIDIRFQNDSVFLATSGGIAIYRR